MDAQSCLTFRFPLSAQVMRHGIRKSDRDEIDRALLLPMWQPIGSETNVGVRIEEAQFSHRTSTVPSTCSCHTPKAQPLRSCAVSIRSFEMADWRPPLLDLQQQLFEFFEPPFE
jgi:hypothetical protein